MNTTVRNTDTGTTFEHQFDTMPSSGIAFDADGKTYRVHDVQMTSSNEGVHILVLAHVEA